MHPENLARLNAARQRARTLRLLRKEDGPFDVEQLIHDFGIPLLARTLPDNERATIGDIRGKRAIILNRRYRFTSPAERRWVLAEELGHLLLEHHLVASNVPGTRLGLYGPDRSRFEREAREFASELLMPLAEVRRRWLEDPAPLSDQTSGIAIESKVKELAKSFGVTFSAIRIRLEQLRLLPHA